MAIKAIIATQFDATGIKRATKEFGKLGNTLRSTLGAVGLGVGLAAITAGLKDAAKAAVEDSKSQALLAQQLKNTIGATDEQVAAVEKSISAMQLSAYVADDVLRPAFAQLVRATGDVAAATKLTQLALDVSAGTGVGLSAVTKALSRAYQGNTTALTRLGIKAKDGVNIFEQLATEFDGAAAAAANNDPFQRMSIVLGEMQEQLGAILLPLLNDFASFLASSDFGKSFSNLVIAIKSAAGALDIFFAGISGKGAFQTLIDLAGAAAVGVAQIAFALADVGTTAGFILSGQFGKAGEQMGSFFTRYNKFVQGIYAEQDKAAASAGNYVSPFNFDDIIVGPDSGTSAKIKAAEQAAAILKKSAEEAQKQLDEQDKIVNEFKTNISELTEAFRGLGESSKELGQFEQQATSAFDALNESIKKGLNDRAITDAAAKYLADYVRVERAALTALARQRDVLLSKIAIAQDISRGVVDAVNITGLLTNETRQITKSVKTLVDGIATTISTTYDEVITGNLADSFKKLVDRTKNFAKNLTALKKLGLNGTLFKQIVDAGSEAGGATAEAIIAGGADTVRELNGLFDELNNAGSEIAKESTDVFYDLGEGVSNAFIDGLKSQEKVLADQIASMVAAIEAAFASMMARLAMLGQAPMTNANGFAYETALPGVSGSASQFGSGTPWAQAVANFRAAPSTAATQVNVVVNAGIGTNGKAVGQQIQAELNKYARSSNR